MSTTTFIIVSALLATTIVNCQNPNYIEKQLLCVLERAPCDSVGQQIKSKWFLFVYRLFEVMRVVCLMQPFCLLKKIRVAFE